MSFLRRHTFYSTPTAFIEVIVRKFYFFRLTCFCRWSIETQKALVLPTLEWNNLSFSNQTVINTAALKYRISKNLFQFYVSANTK